MTSSLKRSRLVLLGLAAAALFWHQQTHACHASREAAIAHDMALGLTAALLRGESARRILRPHLSTRR
jgi:hypothetical protein